MCLDSLKPHTYYKQKGAGNESCEGEKLLSARMAGSSRGNQCPEQNHLGACCKSLNGGSHVHEPKTI